MFAWVPVLVKIKVLEVQAHVMTYIIVTQPHIPTFNRMQSKKKMKTNKNAQIL